jgi:prevent-host-death family protein
MSSREFNQDSSKAKRAAESGPVIITDRGRPAHVLLTFETYRKLAGKDSRIGDLLSYPGVAECTLTLRPSREIAKSAKLS